MMSVLSVKNLVKTFKNGDVENKVLKDISFEVDQGEFIAVMGQSGSGKSTLLYGISGMDELTSGEVRLCGDLISSKSESEMADMRLQTMGFVFQNNYLLKHLSIMENICLPAYKAKRQSKSDIIKAAEALMTKLGIADVKHHEIHKVSGGQLQRAAVCRAMINAPKILFADEPTGALNSKLSEALIEIFCKLNEDDVTLLTVTHDVKMASAASRIIYLKDGKIEAELVVGKLHDKSALKEREQMVLSWLMAQGF